MEDRCRRLNLLKPSRGLSNVGQLAGHPVTYDLGGRAGIDHLLAARMLSLADLGRSAAPCVAL